MLSQLSALKFKGKFSSIWPRMWLLSQHRLSILTHVLLTEQHMLRHWGVKMSHKWPLLPSTTWKTLHNTRFHPYELHPLLRCYCTQAIRDVAWMCTDSKTIALTTAHLHRAEGHCLEKLSQHCSDTALELLQKKEDIMSQLTPLTYFHVHFKPRDENQGILLLQSLPTLPLRRRKKPSDTTCNSKK